MVSEKLGEKSDDLSLMEQIKNQLGLSDDVVELGVRIYKKSLEKNLHKIALFQEGSTEAMIAASVYVACRRKGLHTTLKEVVMVSNISMPELVHMVKIILYAQVHGHSTRNLFFGFPLG